jgi:zinc D-Ala-D-Ala carboxypeptidase
MALRLGIDNQPATVLHRQRLTWLCVRADEVLLVLRRSWPAVKVSSGYRCPALNKAIGGSQTSDHPKALAFDLVAPGVVDYVPMGKYLATYLGDLSVRPQQILAESDHLHVGFPDEIERSAGYVTVVLRETLKDGAKGWAKL